MSTVGTTTSTEEHGSQSPTESTDDDPATLAKDDLFHVLQNERRRRVLRYLEDADGPVEMRDLAERVAAWEHDTTVQALSSDERQRVYISLYQCHLPKLDEMDVLEYDQSRGVVERTALADAFAPYLDVDGGDDGSDAAERSFDPTPYYGGATAVGVLLTAASWVGLVSAAGSVATVVTGLFAAVTLGVLYADG